MGLASWGLDCRHPIYPSVFTNITYFADWIDNIQRLTPLPDPTQFSYQPLQAASSPGSGTTLMTPQAWLPLMFIFRAMWQALQ